MCELDQRVRREVIAKLGPGDPVDDRDMFDKMIAIDRQQTARMKSIVEKHGWPGKSLVGDDGAAAAWLIAQHATHDLPFMEHCTALLEAAVEQGEASPKHLAYLSDRVRVHQGKPQIYGTQFKLVGPEQSLVADPIEDEAHVDEPAQPWGSIRWPSKSVRSCATYRLCSPAQ